MYCVFKGFACFVCSWDTLTLSLSLSFFHGSVDHRTTTGSLTPLVRTGGCWRRWTVNLEEERLALDLRLSPTRARPHWPVWTESTLQRTTHHGNGPTLLFAWSRCDGLCVPRPVYCDSEVVGGIWLGVFPGLSVWLTPAWVKTCCLGDRGWCWPPLCQVRVRSTGCLLPLATERSVKCRNDQAMVLWT
jgi:hypothetical protein